MDNYGRTASGELIGPYDTNAELRAEIEASNRESNIVANVCPDCGQDITLQPSGWWTHDGLAHGCWRLSLDGPDPAFADDEDNDND